jgi:hypothetical protein
MEIIKEKVSDNKNEKLLQYFFTTKIGQNESDKLMRY